MQKSKTGKGVPGLDLGEVWERSGERVVKMVWGTNAKALSAE